MVVSFLRRLLVVVNLFSSLFLYSLEESIVSSSLLPSLIFSFLFALWKSQLRFARICIEIPLFAICRRVINALDNLFSVVMKEPDCVDAEIISMSEPDVPVLCLVICIDVKQLRSQY